MPAPRSAPGFYAANRRWLAPGLLCTLGSSFGQTFFISLFAGQIMAAHGLSDGDWGALYTGATLVSALALVRAGALADTVRLNRLAPAALLGLASAAALMAASTAVWSLFVALAALRFCGQGMISHIGITATARWFGAHRGRALAVAALGFSLGEAFLPSLAVASAGLVGWRGVWLLAALVAGGVLAPVLWRLFDLGRVPVAPSAGPQPGTGPDPGFDGRHWRRAEAVRHWLFWALVPAVLTQGFIGTVIFFQQVHVARVKGWSLSDMALAYPLYAGLTVATLFAAGRFVDRHGAIALLPVYLLPYGLAVGLLGPGQTVWTWYATLALLGVAQGLANTLSGALWPEIYGTRHLGAIRALVVAIIVFSTAAGPGLTGLLIDAGIPFPTQGLAMALWCLALSAGFVAVRRRVARGAAADGPAGTR